MSEQPLPEPVLSHLGAGDRWQLVVPCEIPVGDGLTLTVPEGFTYDLASIPPALMWLIGEDDRLSTLAPLCHDVMYRYRGEVPCEWLAPWYRRFSREESDRLLYTLARRQGCGRLRAWLAWKAVRIIAGRRW